MRIIEKLNKSKEEDKICFSFEYFPPKTEEGVANLYHRIESMLMMQPQFIDVTWGAGGSTAQRTLEICKNTQKYMGVETMMHLTCTNMPRDMLHNALIQAKEAGIHNILALRGDPPRGEEWKKIEGGFANAVDLVRYIRQTFGDHFGLAVAGYPEGHADSEKQEDDLKYLKEKVDAGADFIITQLFYDTQLFLAFVQKCRDIGIQCPIVPGIMPIHTYGGFKRMTTLCQTHVPQPILDALEKIKDDDEEVKEYGVSLAVEMCKKIQSSGIKFFHFYTLNLERTVHRIIDDLGLCDHQRPFPWRRSIESSRCKEDVRPVFWKHRQTSYVKRTESWDDFPNGRWGDSRSPAFGDMSDFHIGVASHIQKEKAPGYGVPLNSINDVCDVFVKYCQGKVHELPWNDLPLSIESDKIKQELINLNSKGILTINSQPRVNGVPSSDPVLGWGPADGWVYQKEYVEFFVSEEKLKFLIEKALSGKYLTYHAVNLKGEAYTNTSGTNALTWGVFVGSEIRQPTVVDSASFLAWKDEAFHLWNMWKLTYPEGSKSYELINDIQQNWFLMNIVDNDFQNGDIFKVFECFKSHPSNDDSQSNGFSHSNGVSHSNGASH